MTTALTDTSFAAACEQVVEVDDVHDLTRAERDALIDAYDRFGIANFRSTLLPAAEAIDALRLQLQLGTPFSPPMYQGTGAVDDKGLASLNVEARDDNKPVHPSFGTTAGQRLHTDATLQPLGLVTTTILYCEEAAASGGETYFLNSAGLFEQLQAADPEAAEALLEPSVLRRISNFGAERHIADGPAFRVCDDGSIQTRFALSSTDYWNIPDGAAGRSLIRAVDFLLAAQVTGSEDYAEIVFQPGTGTIFANDRLSHGRRSFVNGPDGPRSVRRGLFTVPPSKAL